MLTHPLGFGEQRLQALLKAVVLHRSAQRYEFFGPQPAALTGTRTEKGWLRLSRQFTEALVEHAVVKALNNGATIGTHRAPIAHVLLRVDADYVLRRLWIGSYGKERFIVIWHGKYRAFTRRLAHLQTGKIHRGKRFHIRRLEVTHRHKAHQVWAIPRVVKLPHGRVIKRVEYGLLSYWNAVGIARTA